MADIQCAIVIGVDGKETKHFPKNGKKFDIHEMQAFVGGKIETLFHFRYAKTGKLVKQTYANEDGISLRLQSNPVASDMWEGGKKNAEFFGEPNPTVLGPVAMFFPRDPLPSEPMLFEEDTTPGVLYRMTEEDSQ